MALQTDTWEAALVVTPQQEDRAHPSLSTQGALDVRSDGVHLHGRPILQCDLARGPSTFLLILYTDQDRHTVAPQDLLVLLTGHNEVKPAQEECWLTGYGQALSSLDGVRSLFSVTSVSYALRHCTGSQAFFDAWTDIQNALPFPTHFAEPAHLFAACLYLEYRIGALQNAFEQARLASWVGRIEGGRVFLEALEHLEALRLRLPSLRGKERARSEPTVGQMRETPQAETASGLSIPQEGAHLREEVLQRIDWQQPLFLALFFGGLTFLGVCLQPGTDGATGMLFPIAACALMLKLAVHDLRVGQITFVLRFFCNSWWEIVRRALFNHATLSAKEQQLLQQQGITLSPELLAKARKLRSPLPHMDSLAHMLLVLAFDATALGIATIRTTDRIVHGSVLAIFIWILGYAAAALTLWLAVRRRIR